MIIDEADAVFFGKVLGIRSLISYEGESAEELIKDFHSAVDDYLQECKDEGEKPETSYKRSFNVRIGSELHKQAVPPKTLKPPPTEKTMRGRICTRTSQRLRKPRASANPPPNFAAWQRSKSTTRSAIARC